MNNSNLVVLIILDGWGIGPNYKNNAVIQANTPYINSLFYQFPYNQLVCFGEAVGLPEGQMGNSEVGHLNLGAGRIVWQDITRINKAIRENQLANNPKITEAFSKVKQNKSTLHFLGLLSDGGVHSLQTHLYSLIQAAVVNKVKKIAIHAFLDGRDTPPNSGLLYLQELQKFLVNYSQAKIATISGRFWAMDRDKRWNRIKRAWEAMVYGLGAIHTDPITAINESYHRQEYDEFVSPIILTKHGKPISKIKNNDVVIFFNFRGDRARELTEAFTNPNFNEFRQQFKPKLSYFLSMTQYDEKLQNVFVAFSPQKMSNVLAEILSSAGMKQLHIAETEKYAHITFFFNGGREIPFPGEDRILIPSPKVATYDLKPAMSAFEITEETLKHINSRYYNFILVNYANGDMVGHTGVFAATKAAMEILDQCLSKLIPTILKNNGSVLLTADHGNAEQMLDCHNIPYTAHTITNPVPILFIDNNFRHKINLRSGALCDVAPTILSLMGLPQPVEMTGRNLFKK